MIKELSLKVIVAEDNATVQNTVLLLLLLLLLLLIVTEVST